MAVTYVTKSSAGLIPAGVVNDDLLIAVVTGMANKSLALPTANITTPGWTPFPGGPLRLQSAPVAPSGAPSSYDRWLFAWSKTAVTPEPNPTFVETGFVSGTRVRELMVFRDSVGPPPVVRGTAQGVFPVVPVTFLHTGGPQTYTVPAGVTKLAVTLWGGSTVGAKGGLIQAFVTVTPGDVITVEVGGAGDGAGGACAWRGRCRRVLDAGNNRRERGQLLHRCDTGRGEPGERRPSDR